MSARPAHSLLPVVYALAGAAAVTLWRWARLESLDEAAALALALALWLAGRQAGTKGTLALAVGVLAAEWLHPWQAPSHLALPGLEGASSAMVLLVYAWFVGRVERPDSPSQDASYAAPVSEMPDASVPPPDTVAGTSIEVPPAAPADSEQGPDACRGRDDPELVGQVAHELRTPLNAMAGWLHVLESGTSFGEEIVARARLGIRRAVAQQRTLIDAVDELSHATRGDLALARAPVDLRMLAHQAAGTAMSALGEGRQPALQEPQDDAPIWVEVDAERLGRSLSDVLDTIARLREPGAPLQIIIDADADVVRWDCVAPVDATDGDDDMAFATLLRERFEGVVRQGRSRPPPLGVRRARAIASLHGGTFERLEREGVAGIRLTLPLTASRQMPGPGAVSIDDDPLRLGGLRLLVVDDQEEMRDVLVTLLGQQGARVSQADGAAGALALIQGAGDDRFDLAVLDVAMPGEDGLSLVQRIRAAEGRDGFKPMGAIALTAHASTALEQEALASGFDAFLPKPLDPQRLYAAIRALRPIH